MFPVNCWSRGGVRRRYRGMKLIRDGLSSGLSTSIAGHSTSTGPAHASTRKLFASEVVQEYPDARPATVTISRGGEISMLRRTLL